MSEGTYTEMCFDKYAQMSREQKLHVSMPYRKRTHELWCNVTMHIYYNCHFRKLIISRIFKSKHIWFKHLFCMDNTCKHLAKGVIRNVLHSFFQTNKKSATNTLKTHSF